MWMNLGDDVFARHVTPTRYQPGIGLRPGGLILVLVDDVVLVNLT